MKNKTIAVLIGVALMILLASIGVSASDSTNGVLTPEAMAAHEAIVAASETNRPGDPESVTTRHERHITFTNSGSSYWYLSREDDDVYIPPVVTHECTEWRWSSGGTPYSYSAYRTCQLNNCPRPCIPLGGWSGGYHLNQYLDSWTESSGNYIFYYNERTTQWDHFCLGEDFYRYIPETHQGRTFAPYG